MLNKIASLRQIDRGEANLFNKAMNTLFFLLLICCSSTSVYLAFSKTQPRRNIARQPESRL